MSQLIKIKPFAQIAALPPATCSAGFSPRYFRLVTQAAKHYRRSFHTHCSNRRFKHWLREERKCKVKAQNEFRKRCALAEMKAFIMLLGRASMIEPNKELSHAAKEVGNG